MRRFAALFAAVLLSGCAATVQVGPAAPDPEPTVIGAENGIVPTSSIAIYRASEAGFVGNVATAPALLLGDRSLGTCRIGRPLIIRVKPGVYTVTALTQTGKVTRRVTVTEGETTHLRCGTAATPSLTPAPRLDPVDAETANREVGL